MIFSTGGSDLCTHTDRQNAQYKQPICVVAS